MSTRPIARVVMPFSTTRNLRGRTYDCPMPTMTTRCLPSGVQSLAVIGAIKDARPIRTYADAHRALIIRMG